MTRRSQRARQPTISGLGAFVARVKAFIDTSGERGDDRAHSWFGRRGFRFESTGDRTGHVDRVGGGERVVRSGTGRSLSGVSDLRKWLGLAVLVGLTRAAGCLGGTAAGPDAGEPPPGALRVLFIGNSLTYVNDLPALVGAMADSLGVSRPFWSRTAAQPDYALEDHWTDQRTRDALSGSTWDIVAMQQGPSSLPENQANLREWSVRWAELIRSGQALPSLYMVWPESARRSAFAAVSEAYTTAAEAVDGILFPVGRAWLIAWAADPALPLYGPDGFHPSGMGTYLAALVIVDRLYEVELERLPASVRGRSGLVISLPDATRALLISAAREANRDWGR